jgi:two-component system CheB/CheR fusion protein
MHESEVQDRSGCWYRMQIRPYKTVENKIDGATLSLIDIDALKHHVNEAERARGEAERAIWRRTSSSRRSHTRSGRRSRRC